MKKLFFLLCLWSFTLFGQQASPFVSTETSTLVKIGDEMPLQMETAHPYATQIGVIFEETFYNKNSAYIKLYFEDFDLGPEDYVEISTHNTGESIIYAGKGKIVDGQGNTISTFWTQALLDDQVTVRLHAKSPSNNYGFRLSKVAYGYSEEQIEAISMAKTSYTCGRDDKDRPHCHGGDEKYVRSRAVCKLIIGGVGSCTGWLLGSQGHIITNNHCISTAAQANNTDFVFNYEHRSCTGNNIKTSDRVATSSTLIKTDIDLDYTLLKLPNNPTSNYGYLQLSPVVPIKGERVYIVGHPF